MLELPTDMETAGDIDDRPALLRGSADDFDAKSVAGIGLCVTRGVLAGLAGTGALDEVNWGDEM